MRVRIFSKDQQVIALLLGLTVLFICLSRPFHPFSSMLRPSRSDLTTKSPHQWVIEAAGAVKNPGIYTFDKPATPYQVIQSAGGLLYKHRLLSDTLDDTLDTGMRVALQASNSDCAQLIITPMNSEKRLVLGIPVKLNQVSVEGLAMIPGISHTLARRIVEFRESHGPFKTWNDLMCVKGIGPKNLEYFRPYISLK